MATLWGLNPNATYAGAVGDVFVRTTNNEQLRWDGAIWEPIVPPETRADVAPLGGALNQRLGKVASRSFDTGWLNAPDGVVMFHDVTVPTQQWRIDHRLSSRWVDVTVLTPGNANPTAEQTMLVPGIVYETTLTVVLNFARAVAGTAIVRR